MIKGEIKHIAQTKSFFKIERGQEVWQRAKFEKNLKIFTYFIYFILNEFKKNW